MQRNLISSIRRNMAQDLGVPTKEPDLSLSGAEFLSAAHVETPTLILRKALRRKRRTIVELELKLSSSQNFTGLGICERYPLDLEDATLGFKIAYARALGKMTLSLLETLEKSVSSLSHQLDTMISSEIDESFSSLLSQASQIMLSKVEHFNEERREELEKEAKLSA
mgnify:FL=1